jgi:hypothetical protein
VPKKENSNTEKNEYVQCSTESDLHDGLKYGRSSIAFLHPSRHLMTMFNNLWALQMTIR